MSEGVISLVFHCGERAVCHVVDGSAPAGELPSLLSLYFAPQPVAGRTLVWRTTGGERPLDPEIPIGRQVPADAEIHLAPV